MQNSKQFPERGKGKPLKHFPIISESIQKEANFSALQRLHILLFGASDKAKNLKGNILGFAGFPFQEGSVEWKQKHFLLSLLAQNNLREYLNLLCIKQSDDDQPTMINKLMRFLAAPSEESLENQIQTIETEVVSSVLINKSPPATLAKGRRLMASDDFKEGDLVWAKLKGYPLWPGKVVKPPPSSKGLENSHYIYFFGSEDSSWVADTDIKHHEEQFLHTFKRKKPRVLCNGVKVLRQITGVPVKKSSGKKKEFVLKDEDLTSLEEKDIDYTIQSAPDNEDQECSKKEKTKLGEENEDNVDVCLKTEQLNLEDMQKKQKVTPLNKRKANSGKHAMTQKKKTAENELEENLKCDVDSCIKKELNWNENAAGRRLMASEDFKEGDLVWAKLKGYPLWPGKVVKPPPSSKGLENSRYIYFFGSEDSSWVADTDIKHHEEQFLHTFKRKKPRALCNGVKVLRQITGVPVKKSSGKKKEFVLKDEGLTSLEEKDIDYTIQSAPDNEDQECSKKEKTKLGEENEDNVDVCIKTEQLNLEDMQKKQEVTPLNKRKANSGKCAMTQKKKTPETKLEENLKGDVDLCIKKESPSPEDMQKNQEVIVSLRKKNNSFKQTTEENEKKMSSKCKENNWKAEEDMCVNTEPLRPEDMQKKQSVIVPLKKRKTNLGKHVTTKKEQISEMKNNGKSSQENENKKTGEGENVDRVTFSKKNVKSASKKKSSGITLNKNFKPSKKIKKTNLTKKKSNVVPSKVNTGTFSSKSAKTDLEPRTVLKLKKILYGNKFKGSKNLPKLSVAELLKNEFSQKLSNKNEINIAEVLNEDEPSNLQIGFICLNKSGKIIVSKLLEAGYDISLWEGEIDNNLCDSGAKKVDNPEDLILNCDITFSYAPDAGSLGIVFGEHGILKGFEKNKISNKLIRGYVEMGNMDPVVSDTIGKSITEEEGRFLEAPIIGTGQDIENGTLLTLAAGHPILYKDVFNILNVIGKKATYVKYEFGYACRMGLIVNVLPGTVCAALAEALVLTDRVGLPKEDFIECLENGPLGCKFITEKARKMTGSESQLGTPLKLMQEEMAMTLSMGTTTHSSTPILAAANEVYKRAMHGRFSEEDISAVFHVANCKI